MGQIPRSTERILVMKALDGFLMTQRQMTLKNVWVYNVRKRMSAAFLADTIDTI